jgi:hypothetical protein
VAKTAEPKVEILFEHQFNGSDTCEEYYADDINCVLEIGKQHPDAQIKTIEVNGLSFTSHSVEYLVIYRSLVGPAISNMEIIKALKKEVDPEG